MSSAPPRLLSDGPGLLTAADLNHDGKCDLASLGVEVLLSGNRGFLPTLHFGNGTFPENLVVQDLNGDGIPDIAATDDSNAALSGVYVLVGNGDEPSKVPPTTP